MQPEELNGLFRENIRRRRLKLGLTQADVAHRIGARAPYISDLETGKKSPVLGSLAKIAEALETTPQQLLK